MDDSQGAKEEYFNKAQWTTVKKLRKNGDLVVKPSDKEKCFVVMAKESYVDKVNGILRSDVDNEQILTTTDVLNSEMKKVIKATGKKLPLKLEVAAYSKTYQDTADLWPPEESQAGPTASTGSDHM